MQRRDSYKGKYDGLAFFGCLVLISLSALMANDIQDKRTAKKPKIVKPQTAIVEVVPTPQRKPYEFAILNSLQTFATLNENTPVNKTKGRIAPPSINH